MGSERGTVFIQRFRSLENRLFRLHFVEFGEFVLDMGEIFVGVLAHHFEDLRSAESHMLFWVGTARFDARRRKLFDLSVDFSRTRQRGLRDDLLQFHNGFGEVMVLRFIQLSQFILLQGFLYVPLLNSTAATFS